jgi:hypothetical protein
VSAGRGYPAWAHPCLSIIEMGGNLTNSGRLPTFCFWLLFHPLNFLRLSSVGRHLHHTSFWSSNLCLNLVEPCNNSKGRKAQSVHIPAYLGYYVASKLRFFTPGPIHRISSRDGGYIVGTPASVHGSKAVGMACLESMNWVRVTGLFELYWRLHTWSCDPIAHLASEWSRTRNHSGCLQGQ